MAREDYPTGQVIHDKNQLRSPEELRLGAEYYIRNNLPYEKRAVGNIVLVVSLDRLDEGWVTVIDLDVPVAMLVPGAQPSSRSRDTSLSDTGLIPYSNGSLSGRWNPHYWWMKK